MTYSLYILTYFFENIRQLKKNIENSKMLVAILTKEKAMTKTKDTIFF